MTALPDIKAAVMTRLINDSALNTGVSGHIGSVLRKTWGSPPKGVVVRLSGGTPDDYESGIKYQRIDVECYGASPDEGSAVWQLTHPVLCPRLGDSLASFTLEGCRVYSIEKESGPAEFIDDITHFPFCFASYVVRWSVV